MSQAFGHRPVLEQAVVELFASVPAGTIIDATVGGGGHAAALLASQPRRRIVGLDRDPDAIAAAASRLGEFGDRLVLRHARFDALPAVVDALDVTVAGVLFDLGVSSPQFDRPERGFSYRAEAPLDMRMDPTENVPTAADVVNEYSAARLADLFRASGETRYGRRIAEAIVRARPVTTTTELADLVRDNIPAPARRRGGHPARRVFQALRIEVNQELVILGGAVDDAIRALIPGGRVVVLSYHSGEDRIVKDRLRQAATGGCTCPPGLPCVCGAVSVVRLLTRGARKPTAEEVARNPRAESARLRVAEKLAPAGVS